MSQNAQRTRFNKLSLKKNHVKPIKEPKKLNRSSDLIILDELDDTFDRLKLSVMNNVKQPLIIRESKSPQKLCSPIVIDDSSEMSFNIEPPNVAVRKKKSPSKMGNVSFNCSQSDTSIHSTNDQPSIGGWSPAQNILCATPRNLTIPSTPKDVANESSEQCSIKDIQKSQKKLLDELYGEVWKSIPTLFKRKTQEKDENFEAVTKKLQFEDSPTKDNSPKRAKDDYDSDKENIQHILAETKKLYLTGSDAKNKVIKYDGTEKKSRKKLYTEKVPCTPDIAPSFKIKVKRDVNTTTKKLKNKTVTELVEIMKGKYNINQVNDTLTSKVKERGDKILKDVYKTDTTTSKDIIKPKDKILKDKSNTKLTKDVKSSDRKVRKYDFDDYCENLKSISASPVNSAERLSFVGSLADNVPSWRCNVEAIQYRDKFKTEKERLTRRLFTEFNKNVFDNGLDADMIVEWDGKLRSTAGTTTNRLIKNSKGERIRSSSIKLSTKVLDTCQRLRDTLIHEMCHAATWILDQELRAGHGPLWKRWACLALRAYPELGEISRCHDLEIHFKYSYKCTKCGYTIKRHSKSIDATKKCCGYCRGTFTLIVNRKNKDGVVVSTPSRGGEANRFAMFVKENYGEVKSGRTHAEAMKCLSEKFAEAKKSGKLTK